ncbi:MAG: hypothetical protein WHT65_00915 [Pseudothermotoga sp.]
MKKLLILSLSIVFCISSFSIINEEQARELFSQALSYWYEGDVTKAKSLMDDALSGLIYVSDIPEFWFFTSKIDIDMRAVEKAQEDLKTILVISPGKPEVLSLLKEIETLLKPLEFSTPTVLQEALQFEGFVKGVEYFYTPNCAVFLENSLVIADKANKRLVRSTESGYEIFKLSTAPSSLAVSPKGELYLSGDGKLVLYDVKTNSEQVVYDGFVNPILAGFDRIGRLWGSDVDRVFVYDGKAVRFLSLDDFFIINDIELTPYGFWILDVMSDQLIYYDFSLNKLKSIPAHGAWNFETTILGDPIILTKDLRLSVLRDDAMIDFYRAAEGTVFFEYFYPYVIFFNWNSNTVTVRPMKSEEPIIVKVDTLNFENENLKLIVRTESIYGDPIPCLKDFLEVREGGGPVFFNLSVEYSKLQWLKGEQSFFEKTLPFIKRGSTHGVFFENLPGDYRKTDLVTLRGKNVKIFSKSDPTEFILLSGGAGMLSSPVEIWQPVYRIWFSRTRPLPSDITPVTVQLRLGQELYSDTIYYTRGLIK